MINSHFLITIFDYDIEDDKSWIDITDFIEVEGSNNLDTYLGIETDFIKAIKMFNDFFSKNEYFDSLVTKIEVYEDEDDFNFYSLDGDYQKLLQLSRSNFSSLSDSDKEFIYRCQCRRMCSLWFVDVVSMSYLMSAMDPFFYIYI